MFGLSLRTVLASLSAVSFLLAAALGAVALHSLDTVSDGARTLSGDILVRVTSADGMSVALSNLRISEAEHVSSSNVEAKRAAEAAIAAAKRDFASALKAFNQATAGEQARGPAARVASDMTAYDELDRTFVDYSSTYREIDAGALFVSKMKETYDAMASGVKQLIAISARDAETTSIEGEAARQSAWRGLVALVLLALCASAASAAFGIFGVSRPIGRIRDAMSRIADGDLAAATPYEGRRDEIGAIAAAVAVFKQGLIHARRLERETEEARAGAEELRRAATHDMAERFEGAIGGIVATVSAAATELQATAQAMDGAAGRTASQSAAVVDAARKAAQNVGTIAGAAERLGSAVEDIGRQAAQSVDLARATVDDAQRTGELVLALSDAASKIGHVVDVISSIAAQTNLLALNATIEAARAGESGRGFAVVAAEVKALAEQTASATDEIGRQIAGIQATTATAVDAIGEIRQRIGAVSGKVESIADAVAEQGAATQDIARNVAHAASGTQDVTENVSGVAASADDAGAAASQVLQAASELSRQSERLGAEVGGFLASVRAA